MMRRRVSAGELEDRYNIKHALFDFYMKMLHELIAHAEEKGTSWQDAEITKKYLIGELKQHLKNEDWISVANFAFFLRDREINKDPVTLRKLIRKRIAALEMKAKPPKGVIQELTLLLQQETTV